MGTLVPRILVLVVHVEQSVVQYYSTGTGTSTSSSQYTMGTLVPRIRVVHVEQSVVQFYSTGTGTSTSALQSARGIHTI